MEGSLQSLIDEKLDDLSTEARELYLESHVPRLRMAPSPLEFYRKYVSPNKPVIIEGGISHWPGIRKWSPDYFRNKIGDQTVTVAVTPNGYADAVNAGKFVMPEERQMKMCQFLDILEKSDIQYNGVFYIQKQNSNLTKEFTSIIEDVETDIPWGTEAFGKLPDAVNFWMGDGRAITSTHRDHYENLYCVVQGWKKFILIPPTDLPHVPYETYQAALYKQDENGQFQIIDDAATGMVPWVAIDPLNPDLERYPQYAKCRPVEVTVREGEVLYLPSLWFHHVQQSHGCIAVNFWYDMEFDIKYSYYKFMENIIGLSVPTMMAAADELQAYLDRAFREGIQLDISAFWRVLEDRLHRLAVLAKVCIALPVSSVEAECSFSKYGLVLSSLRYSLSQENLQA